MTRQSKLVVTEPHADLIDEIELGSRGEDFDDEHAGSRIKSVSLTIRLLKEIAAAGGPIGVSELARRVGVAKARTHRHLVTLRDAGLVEQGQSDDRYRLGWLLFDLGQAAAAQFDIGRTAAPALRLLRDTTKLSVVLGQRTNDEIIVVETFDSETMIAVTVRKGLRLPAHRSAMGLVMLAYALPEDQRRILGKPLPGVLPGTLIDRTLVQNRLSEIRAKGYEVLRAGSEYGVDGIASPILNADDQLIAVIAVIGTTAQIGDPVHLPLLTQLMETSATVSALLGRNPLRR